MFGKNFSLCLLSLSLLSLSAVSSGCTIVRIDEQSPENSVAESYVQSSADEVSQPFSPEPKKLNKAEESQSSLIEESSQMSQNSAEDDDLRNIQESSEEEESVEESSQEEEEIISPEEEKAYQHLLDILGGELQSSQKELPVEYISQYPELPTGCESVALTVALRSLGYDLEKTAIADEYMVYGYDYITSYLGNPHEDDGAGIFPPGIVKTAKNFIKDQNAKLAVFDTTGTDIHDLYKLVDNGYPVVLWSSLYLRDPYFTDDSVEYNGIVYPWYENEHCVVLYGYDFDSNIVYISDSRAGLVTYDMDSFEYTFNLIGKFSVSLIKTDFDEQSSVDEELSDTDISDYENSLDYEIYDEETYYTENDDEINY